MILYQYSLVSAFRQSTLWLLTVKVTKEESWSHIKKPFNLEEEEEEYSELEF